MNTIRIVTNSDRCHVSVNGTPEHTFIYCSYMHTNPEFNKLEAIRDAKAECFNQLVNFKKLGVKAVIDPIITPA